MFEKLQPFTPFNQAVISSNVATFKKMKLPSTLAITEKDFNQPGLEAVPILIVCPGLSSREIVAGAKTRLQALVERGTHKVVLAGAAVQFLYDGTLRADQVEAVVFNNPESTYEKVMEGPGQIEGVRFYTATHCRPEVFSLLKKNHADIRTWHAHVDGLTSSFSNNKAVIGTGYGATMGAIPVMAAFGHREFEAVGWDGVAAYAIPLDSMPDYKADIEQRHMMVEIDGRQYCLYEGFGGDVPEFASFANEYPHAIKSLFLHGNHPTAKMLNAENGPRTDFSNIRLPQTPGSGENTPNPEPIP